MNFLSIRLLDIIDIVLVAILLYQVYMMIKGTVAINVFFVLFATYLLWLLMKALNMQLLGTILGQVMGIGVIAAIIVFQQELRRFFLTLGNRYFTNQSFTLEGLFSLFKKEEPRLKVKIFQIVTACRQLAKTKTGMLIVIANNSELRNYAETGEIINADTNSRLLETIFYKNSPLHDGAVIIDSDRIYAAGCVLPISRSTEMPKNLGLRHRAALGISEITDAFAITVSEETGKISYFFYGKMEYNVMPEQLAKQLRYIFSSALQTQKNA